MQFNKMAKEKSNKLERECLRFLIVDDKKENLDAAKQYFGTLENMEFLYSSNPSDATKTIIESVLSKNYIDYALIDLEMQGDNGEVNPVAGHNVSVEAWKRGIINVIATQHYNANHGGDSTHIYSEAGARGGLGSVSGKKDNPDTWKKLYDSFDSIKKRYAPLRSVVLEKRKNGETDDLWEGIIKTLYSDLRKLTLNGNISEGFSPMFEHWKKGEYEYK